MQSMALHDRSGVEIARLIVAVVRNMPIVKNVAIALRSTVGGLQ